GVSDLIGFDVFDKPSHLRLRMRLVRLGDEPSFSKSDRARLESIVPLMDKALQLYSAYTHNSFIEAFYEDLLGSMDIASVIVNANLEVLSANQPARQILRERDGVYVRHDALRCSSSTDQKKLEEACRELLELTRKDEQAQSTMSIAIARASLETKWDVHIRLVPKQNVVFDQGGPELVLLLQGPVRECAPSQARLIDVFGVTPAEAKLIAHLVDGLTLTAAAQALGVSRNTARTQLSSIFGKTGVNRQAQLVKLVSDSFASHWQ
ncbi:MAG: helix-turn-helix transcriptional regulator, partial [Pseudomonadales bacterium]